MSLRSLRRLRRSCVSCIFLFCSALALVCVVPSKASAQDTATLKQEIRALLTQGKSLAEAGKFKEATVKFFAALTLFQTLEESTRDDEEKRKLKSSKTTFLYYLGRSYQLDKQLAKAFEYYLRCAKNDPQTKSGKACATEIAVLQASLPADVQKQVQEAVEGRRVPEPRRLAPASRETSTHGTLLIRSSPAGIKVYKDDRLIAQLQSPQESLRLPKGSYKLSFRKEGYVAVEEAIEILAGATLPLTIELKKQPPEERRGVVVPPKRAARSFEIALALGGGTGGGGFLQVSWRPSPVFSLVLAGGTFQGIADLDVGFVLRPLLQGFVGGGLQLHVGDPWCFVLRVIPGLGFVNGDLGFFLLVGAGVVYRFRSGLFLGLTADIHAALVPVGSLLGLGGYFNLGYAF